MTDQTQSKIERFNFVFIGAFFISLFLHIWLWIKPNLIYQMQEPVFFFGNSFLAKHLNYPGGLIEYISAFLSQFYIYPIIGALIITLVIAAVCFSVKKILATFSTGRSVYLIYLVPAIVLLSLHSNYQYPLSYSLSLLVALLFFNIYKWMPFQQTTLSPIIYFFLCAVLYYTVAGPFLIFSLLCILYELFNEHHSWRIRISLSVSYGLLTFFIPYLLVSYFFLINIKNTYTYLLPFSLTYELQVMPYLLYAFFPIAVISMVFGLRIPAKAKRKIKKSGLSLIHLTSNIIIQVGVLCALTGIFAFIFTDKEIRKVLQLGEDALYGRWNDILEYTKDKPSLDHRIVAFHMNRALYHTGQLSNNMFAFPQNIGIDGLIKTDGVAFQNLMENSDLMYELGHFNSAQSWAYEALSMKGETPRILKRLALVHIIKKEYPVARKYLDLLRKTLFNRKWAEPYLESIANPELLQRTREFQRAQSLMVKSDFLIRHGFPKIELELLFENNKQNKMVFEYLVAFELLSCRLDNFIKYLEYLKELNYKYIPKHYEEAILLFLAQRRQEKFRLEGFRFRQELSDRFSEFMLILQRHGNDKRRARKDLIEKFGDTYWFYLLYNI